MDRSEQAERVIGMRTTGEIPRPARPAAVLTGLFVCVCMLYPVLHESRALAGLLLLFAAAMLLLLIRSPFVIAMFAVPAFLLIGLTGDVVAAAVPLALLCGVGFGAFLLLTVRSLSLALVPLAAFLLGFLATGELTRAAVALLCLPAACVLAHAMHAGLSRTRTICRVGAVLFVTLLLAALCCILPRYGMTVFENVAGRIDEARASLAAVLAGWQTGEGEHAARVVLEGMEFALAGALFNILPGVVLAVLSVMAYMADLICLALFRTFEWEKYLSARVFVLVVSVHAAALYAISYLLLLMMGRGGSESMQFVSVVVENCHLALFPAMIFAGAVFCIRTYLLSHRRLLLLVVAILVAAMMPSFALTAMSLLGAGDVLCRALRKRLRRRHRDGDA